MQVAGRAGSGDLDEKVNEACEDIDAISHSGHRGKDIYAVSAD